MLIRQGQPRDLARTLEVERLAFGSELEPQLVAELLEDPTAAPLLSLLAWEGARCVGHVLFTAARVESNRARVDASLLAPLAVVPEMQGRGVGIGLMRAGVEQLATSGVELVFVLGHPTYYPRVGFRPALPLGFEPPHAIDRAHTDAWMVLPLKVGALDVAPAKIRCAKALDAPVYWE